MAAWYLERYHIKGNKKTAYEDCFQTSYHGALYKFCETVVSRHPSHKDGRRTLGRTQQKADNQFNMGIWYGKTYDSNEDIVSDLDGTHTCRAIKRLPLSQQASLELLKTVSGVPWDLTHVSKFSERRTAMSAPPAAPAISLEAAAQAVLERGC